jgi:apolipoprotein N-acyltransferase
MFSLRFLIPFLSGLLLSLAFPKPGLYFLAWIALVPLFLNISRQNIKNKDAFKEGFVFGLSYFFGTLYWIYHSIHYYGGMGLVWSILAVIALSTYLSLYTGTFTFLISLIHKRTLYPLLITAPSLWVSLEYIRTYLFTGFPWSSIGYSQYKMLHLIQIADITGIYGISFLVVAFNGAIVDMILLKKRTEEIPLYPLGPRIAGAFLLILAFIFTFVYGHKRLNQNRPGTDIRVSIVQGNIPQDKKWDPGFQREVMNIYENLTRETVKRDSPDIIIWPETAVPFIFKEPESSENLPSRLHNDELLSRELVEFVKEIKTYLLFGSIRQEYEIIDPKKSRQEVFTNSAFLLNRDGKVTYIYDKIHLVPFGEYVPLRKLLFFIDKITIGIGDYRPGNYNKRAVTPFGTFSTLICYEIIFPGLAKESLKEGGDFIVNITNDAWFGKTSGPYQHFTMAVFRAIENRKPVIRAANTGISGFIDSNGNILSASPLFERLSVSMTVKTDNTRTFYSRYGDLFVYFCLLITISVLSKSLKI